MAPQGLEIGKKRLPPDFFLWKIFKGEGQGEII